jgi:hypothetical protein
MPHPSGAKCHHKAPRYQLLRLVAKELQNSNHMKILDHVWLQKKWKLPMIYTSSYPPCKRYAHLSFGFSFPAIVAVTMARTMFIVGGAQFMEPRPKLPLSDIAPPLLDSAHFSSARLGPIRGTKWNKIFLRPILPHVFLVLHCQPFNWQRHQMTIELGE